LTFRSSRISRNTTQVDSEQEAGLSSALATLGVRVVIKSLMPDSMDTLLSSAGADAYVRTLSLPAVLDAVRRLCGAW
jgi:hypothetical protein